MFIVQLEFKRIQTFLFASPRLKDMVGANALLGNVLRQDLPDLVCRIRGNEPFTQNKELLKKYKAKFQKSDPLSKTGLEGWYKDIPQESWEKGVLSRDGGHFYAVFPSREDALAFQQQALSIVQTTLPGVLVEYTVSKDDPRMGQVIASGMIEADNLPILPIFQPCQFSDQGVAEDKIRHKDANKQYQSTSSRIKREFLNQNGETKEKSSADIASVLTESWLQAYSATQAYDLDKLAGSDYLAVIVADGNNMGQRFKAFRASEESKLNNRKFTWLEEQAIAEAFFFKARTAMRKATDQAINEHYTDRLQNKTLPFQLLMLGGDDLLIACQAKDALPLITLINEKLSHKDHELLDGKTMTLGTGVVMASHSMPFYRLHHIAEELASSAKVKARSEDQHESVIDWQTITQSWVDDPILARRKTEIIRYQSGVAPETQTEETLILTQKPYAIDSISTPVSLKQLLQRADLIYASIQGDRKLYQQLIDQLQADNPTLSDTVSQMPEQSEAPEVARSQLRYLQSQLATGRRHSELAWKKLPAELRNLITQLFTNTPLPWESKESWGLVYQTLLSDLIELIEIQTLQRELISKQQAIAAAKV